MTQSLILPTRVTQKFAERKENLSVDGVSKRVTVPDSQKPNVENYNVELMYKVLFGNSF